jgi:hypothetical protein
LRQGLPYNQASYAPQELLDKDTGIGCKGNLAGLFDRQEVDEAPPYWSGQVLLKEEAIGCKLILVV